MSLQFFTKLDKKIKKMWSRKKKSYLLDKVLYRSNIKRPNMVYSIFEWKSENPWALGKQLENCMVQWPHRLEILFSKWISFNPTVRQFGFIIIVRFEKSSYEVATVSLLERQVPLTYISWFVFSYVHFFCTRIKQVL